MQSGLRSIAMLGALIAGTRDSDNTTNAVRVAMAKPTGYGRSSKTPRGKRRRATRGRH